MVRGSRQGAFTSTAGEGLTAGAGMDSPGEAPLAAPAEAIPESHMSVATFDRHTQVPPMNNRDRRGAPVLVAFGLPHTGRASLVWIA